MKRFDPDTIAACVSTICSEYHPGGFSGAEYYGAPRLAAVAKMAAALRSDLSAAAADQLRDRETFEAVYDALEWYNEHTANLALELAYGDAEHVYHALQTIHYHGQSYAIERGYQYPRSCEL